MPLLYWCKTELFYVTWRTPLWTQELSRLFLKYWNSSYVWNTTHNCSCFSVKNTILLLDLIFLRLFKLETAPGGRWWPRAARRTRQDYRTPPTKPTSHLRPSRPTGPLLEARPLVFDSLFLVCKQCVWTFFGWISILMKPKGSVNQRQTQKLHLLWNEITSPRLILKCESEQLRVLTRGQVSKSSWGSDFMVSFYV